IGNSFEFSSLYSFIFSTYSLSYYGIFRITKQSQNLLTVSQVDLNIPSHPTQRRDRGACKNVSGDGEERLTGAQLSVRYHLVGGL
ncbi:MAG TPA: hypothetical protein VE843_18455, partial [Ktedonobacteraceae bacterium]|nr:hypothetical protein [Ktedonobacteraceae bacterium]